MKKMLVFLVFLVFFSFTQSAMAADYKYQRLVDLSSGLVFFNVTPPPIETSVRSIELRIVSNGVVDCSVKGVQEEAVKKRILGDGMEVSITIPDSARGKIELVYEVEAKNLTGLHFFEFHNGRMVGAQLKHGTPVKATKGPSIDDGLSMGSFFDGSNIRLKSSVPVVDPPPAVTLPIKPTDVTKLPLVTSVTGLRHDPVLQQKLLSNPDSLEPGDFAREGIVINSRQNWTWGPDLTTYRFLDVYLSDSKEANHSTDGAMRYVVTAVFDDYGINVHAVTYGNDKGKTRENREKRMDDERYSVIITPINPERGYREFFHDFDVMGTGAAYKWFVWEDETGNLYVKEVSLYPSQKPWRADSGIALPSIFKVTNGYVDLDTKALANLNLNPYTYPPVSSNVTTESPVVADSSITGLGQITVKVDGKNVAFDVPPFIENGRTLVPFRAIGEALGCEVRWDQDQQKVTCISRNGQIAEMIIGEKTIWVNRIEETVDVAPVIVSGRTFVPVRWLSYAVGAETEWSAEKRTVIITSPAPLK